MLLFEIIYKGGNHEINTPNKECVLDFNSSVSAWFGGKFCQHSFRYPYAFWFVVVGNVLLWLGNAMKGF